ELAGDFQVRITLRQEKKDLAALKFIGLSLANTKSMFDPLPPHKSAWGKLIAVKRRSQVDYPEGVSSWCSPTATSMILSFWSTNLMRADLDYDVPEVVAAVNDPNWPGTGNWPFNTAFAGSHKGIRA